MVNSISFSAINIMTSRAIFNNYRFGEDLYLAHMSEFIKFSVEGEHKTDTEETFEEK